MRPVRTIASKKNLTVESAAPGIETRGQKLWLVAAFCICLSTIALVAVMPKHVGYDSELGILSAMHYALGKSEAIDRFATGNPVDLSVDISARNTWWAPGYQAIPYLFHKMGLAWGAAICACSATFLTLGFIVWTAYFQIATRSWRMTAFCTIVLACCPYVQEMIFVYNGGDLFEWVFVPIIVLLAYYSAHCNGWTSLLITVALGILCWTGFFLKYSTVLYSIAAAACVGANLLLFSAKWRRLIRFIIFFGIAAALLYWIDGRGSNAPASAFTGWSIKRFENAGMTLCAPPLAGTDAFKSIWRSLLALTRFSLVLTQWLCLVGGAGLWVLLLRSWGIPVIARPSIGVLPHLRLWQIAAFSAVAQTCLLVLIILSGLSLYGEPRLVRSSGVLLLPFLFMTCARMLISKRSILILTALSVFGVVGLYPAGFGIARTAYYLHRIDLTVDGSCTLLHTSLGRSSNVEEFVAEIETLAPSRQSIIVPHTPSMMYAFPERRAMPGRVIPAHLRAGTVDSIRAMSFNARNVGIVALLLDKDAVGSASVVALQQRFHGVSSWKTYELRSAPFWVLIVGHTDAKEPIPNPKP